MRVRYGVVYKERDYSVKPTKKLILPKDLTRVHLHQIDDEKFVLTEHSGIQGRIINSAGEIQDISIEDFYDITKDYKRGFLILNRYKSVDFKDVIQFTLTSDGNFTQVELDIFDVSRIHCTVKGELMFFKRQNRGLQRIDERGKVVYTIRRCLCMETIIGGINFITGDTPGRECKHAFSDDEIFIYHWGSDKVNVHSINKGSFKRIIRLPFGVRQSEDIKIIPYAQRLVTKSGDNLVVVNEYGKVLLNQKIPFEAVSFEPLMSGEIAVVAENNEVWFF